MSMVKAGISSRGGVDPSVASGKAEADSAVRLSSQKIRE